MIRLLVAAAIALPLWLTLPGDPGAALAADRTPWYCISCGAGGTADLLQNSLLLLPLGFGLALLGWQLGSSAILLVLLPIGIEVTQGLMAAGRDAALGDVLANATGGLLGWFAGRERLRLLWPDPRRAAPLVSGIFVAQLLATASLNLPSPVGPEPWSLRLVPEVPGRPAYRGAVELLTLDGRSILADHSMSRQPGDANVTRLASRFTWDPHPDPLPGTIARLDDAREWGIFSIDRRSDAVAMTLRTRGARMQLREPTWLIPVPDHVVTGDTIDASLTLGRGQATMSLADRTLQVPYGPQHGWVLINPFAPVHSSATTWDRWTLAWLAGWGLLLGWFTTGDDAGGAGRRPYRSVTWLGLSVAALLMITSFNGARATPLQCVALAAGWGVARISRIPLRSPPDVA